MSQSVTKETPIQIRSHTLEYDDPDRVQDYHNRDSGFGMILYVQIHFDTIQHLHLDQMRSIKIGCGFGLRTFTITIEGDHDLSHDLTRRVYKQPN